MSKSFDFLKDVYPFFVLTANNEEPNGRPFGAVCEINDKLYIATSPKKQVYKEIVKNPNLTIVAIKQGTRDWIRIKTIAYETGILPLKAKVLSLCPILKKHYKDENDDNFAVFELTITSSTLYTTANGVEKLV